MRFFFRKNKKVVAKAHKSKSRFREWMDAVFFAVIAATIIRGLFIEAYAIPTGSMENTMMVGDHLFVSKMHYGTRTPRTLLQLPLMHQTIYGTKIPSYLDWVQLPSLRLPSIGSVERNDIVVFNYPKEKNRPVDMKTFYVKRCVGMPGDKLSIEHKQILINGTPIENPAPLQASYLIKSEGLINDRVFRTYNISDVYATLEGYMVHTSEEVAEKLSKLPYIKEVKEIEYENISIYNQHMYPHDFDFGWSIDNYGPIYIPAKGHEIHLTDENVALYKEVIIDYEGNNALYHQGKILIDGTIIEKYTFQQDYYFMMGDNRHNSEDSRFWGFVPSDHIVGKPLFVYYSTDEKEKNNSILSKIRWSRMFHLYK